ncbi:MAG: pentapeptide repeat-containing protein, partial [Fibrobacteres bacterium]|nr:pentapeptide repeat-containing protein [Fibrobacterota bacterium]
MNEKKLNDKTIQALFQTPDLSADNLATLMIKRKPPVYKLLLKVAAVIVITLAAFLAVKRTTNYPSSTFNGCKPDTFFVMMIKKSVKDFNNYRIMNPNAEIVLCNAKLENLNLENINLKGLILDNADFRGSNLTNANFENAKADGIILEKSVMLGASLKKAVITNSRLRESNLGKANLTSITLQNSDLNKSNLNETKLDSAVISDVAFKESIL